MNKKSYETPAIREFALLSEQTFLQGSAGGTMNFGNDNEAGGITTESIWGDF